VIKLLILIKIMRLTATKRMKTDSPPDTKSAEQSDEDVLRQESFKKGKRKVIAERQKAH